MGTDEFAAWYGALRVEDAEAVTRAITVLEKVGFDDPNVAAVAPRMGLAPNLPLFELTVRDSDVRVLLAKDPDGRAVLLYGYDAVIERRVDSEMTAVAHLLLAAKVYFHYRGVVERRP